MDLAELPQPWALVREISAVLPAGSWTLIGGLMVQAHALHAGLEPTRTTRDVDLLLHIETGVTTYPSTRRRLTGCGFTALEPAGRNAPEHRFVRGTDVVDVLIADHPGPWAVANRVGATSAVKAPGGTSALRKTVTLEIPDGQAVVRISLPNIIGALTLKGGAYREDSRDRERHLEDAAVLAATIDDAEALAEDTAQWTSTDRRRIATLWAALEQHTTAWEQIPAQRRLRARASLKTLAAGPG